MTTLMICRDAIEDSVLGNLAVARSLANKGEAVTVVFTGACLDALAEGTFEWSWSFRKREPRAAIIGKAEEAGLHMAHERLDPRWSDPRNFVKTMNGKSGIRLVACPVWSNFLSVGAEPAHLERISEDQLADLILKADRIIGTY